MATITRIDVKQGTTPLLTAVLDGEDITEATVYLAVKTGDRMIVKTNYYDDGELVLTALYDEDDALIGTEITAQFSQEETLYLRPGSAKVEANWIFDDGSVDKSNVGIFNITKTLYSEVLKYGNEYTS